MARGTDSGGGQPLRQGDHGQGTVDSVVAVHTPRGVDPVQSPSLWQLPKSPVQKPPTTGHVPPVAAQSAATRQGVTRQTHRLASIPASAGLAASAGSSSTTWVAHAESQAAATNN